MDWGRAGRRIEVERARYWPRRADFARATGLSVRLLADLEGGKRQRYSPTTLAAVEVALGWEPGTCERLAEGRRVVYDLSDSALRRVYDTWPFLTEAQRRRVASIAEGLRQDSAHD